MVEVSEATSLPALALQQCAPRTMVSESTQSSSATPIAGSMEGLKKRKRKPYVLAHDVHRCIVKAETYDDMCRYCELPGMAEQTVPETERHWFGLADHFFSYNWDWPFDDVLDAICTHSDAQVAVDKAPPHYWVDNCAINQHERTSDDSARQRQLTRTPSASGLFHDDHCW